MAQDVVAVLDHVDWQRAILLGHSMGGRSSTYVAAKHHARIAGLALIDYTPDNAPAGATRTTEIVGNTRTPSRAWRRRACTSGPGKRSSGIPSI